MFGPTGESETYYNRDPLHPDMWGLKELDRQDVLSDLVINHIESIVTTLARLAFWRGSNNAEDQSAQDRVKGIFLDKIRAHMNLVAGLYGPLLFTISMAIVSCLSSPKAQIAVVGILGGVLSISVQLMVENVKRADLFMITAGYYAVLGIFIGKTGGGSVP
jgi:hypothetical protein